jgi:hypothetical protein
MISAVDTRLASRLEAGKREIDAKMVEIIDFSEFATLLTNPCPARFLTRFPPGTALIC